MISKEDVAGRIEPSEILFWSGLVVLGSSLQARPAVCRRISG